MTALNTIVNSFTGPRCLRAALREKTAPIHRLLESLDRPTELRVSIPASVFGGDIFGVMSRHLREALVCPPAQPVSTPRAARRKRILQSVERSGFEKFGFPNPSNSFPLNETFESSTTSEAGTSGIRGFTDLQKNRILQIKPSSQETELAKEMQTAHPCVPQQPQPQLQQEIHTPTQTRTLRDAPALVSSLHRYWESIAETRATAHVQPQASLAEVLAARPGFPVSESDQRTAPRTWPTLAAAGVSEKLRAFSSISHPASKPNRLNSKSDGQVQNVFNIEVKNANQFAPDYDDLGERIAQILQEQALQHGIDIT